MEDQESRSSTLPRRAFLIGGTVVVGGAAATLAACGSSGGSSTSSSAAPTSGSASPSDSPSPTSSIARGGILTYAITDSANTESLDPMATSYTSDSLICGALYEGVVKYNDNWEIENVLAESVEANADASEWTVTLKKGVMFHDGTELTAKDVIYTIGRNIDEEAGSPIQARVSGSLDVKGMTAVDDHTIKFTLKRPDSAFGIGVLGARQCLVVKDGTTDFSKGNGTGPFTLVSFTPGTSWEVAKNANYWNPELPYLDGAQAVVIPDQTTKVQSVLSGQALVGDNMPATAIPQVDASGNCVVQTRPNQTLVDIAMDSTQAPFDNEKLTLAIKFATARDLMLATAQGGQGTVTGDCPAPMDDPFYPMSTVGDRVQDIEKAKTLLAEAGYPDGIDIELFTSDVFGGMVDMATVFAESVKPAGIRVKLNKYPADSYWDDVWLKKPMYTSYYQRRFPSEALSLNYISTAEWNEGRFNSPELDQLVNDGLATSDEAQQKEIYGKAFTIVADQAGMLIPYFINTVAPAAKSVQGIDYMPQFTVFDRAWIDPNA